MVSTHGFTGSAGEVIIVIMIDANPNTIFPGHKEYRWHPLGVLSSVKAGRQAGLGGQHPAPTTEDECTFPTLGCCLFIAARW